MEADALAAGKDVSPLVFPSEAGTPLDDVSISRRFQTIMARAAPHRVNG